MNLFIVLKFFIFNRDTKDITFFQTFSYMLISYVRDFFSAALGSREFLAIDGGQWNGVADGNRREGLAGQTQQPLATTAFDLDPTCYAAGQQTAALASTLSVVP